MADVICFSVEPEHKRLALFSGKITSVAAVARHVTSTLSSAIAPRGGQPRHPMDDPSHVSLGH